VVPVRLSQRGARVEIPEFPLRADVANLDPDTNEPSTTPYSAIP
jgi:hypothetical protein